MILIKYHWKKLLRNMTFISFQTFSVLWISLHPSLKRVLAHALITVSVSIWLSRAGVCCISLDIVHFFCVLSKKSYREKRPRYMRNENEVKKNKLKKLKYRRKNTRCTHWKKNPIIKHTHILSLKKLFFKKIYSFLKSKES